MPVMDLFDADILSVLKDGRSHSFPQLLTEVSFSHNTLRLHLARLIGVLGLLIEYLREGRKTSDKCHGTIEEQN